jgi:hypothetical protein
MAVGGAGSARVFGAQLAGGRAGLVPNSWSSVFKARQVSVHVSGSQVALTGRFKPSPLALSPVSEDGADSFRVPQPAGFSPSPRGSWGGGGDGLVRVR